MVDDDHPVCLAGLAEQGPECLGCGVRGRVRLGGDEPEAWGDLNERVRRCALLGQFFERHARHVHGRSVVQAEQNRAEHQRRRERTD